MRLNLLPDPRFAPLRNALDERMRLSADAIHADNFESLLDPLLRQTLGSGFQRAGAHEGTVWLVDASREHLVAACNTGPNAARFVGEFNQPLGSGLISMVYANEQPFSENAVYQNAMQDKRLDQRLGVLTCAMIAVPFYFAGSLRGVISCVQLKEAASTKPDPPGFAPESLRSVQFAATVAGKLIDLQLLSIAVGWGQL